MSVERRRYLPAGAGWPACYAAAPPSPPAVDRTLRPAGVPHPRPRTRTSAAGDQPPSKQGILKTSFVVLIRVWMGRLKTFARGFKEKYEK